MSKKRLEEIKHDVDVNCKKEYEFITTILYADALWLIEQAERLEYLMTAIEEEPTLLDRITKIEQQNKRYREVIMKIIQTSKDYREGYFLDIQDSSFVDEIIAIIKTLEVESDG